MIAVTIGIFLLLFWGGVILMVLATAHVLAVSALSIFIGWLIVMAIYLTGWGLFVKKAMEYADWQTARRQIERAEEVAKSKILRMHQEDAERRSEYMCNDKNN